MPIFGEGTFAKKVKNIFIGKELDPNDHTVFHRLSLIAFFAWVGLGADGLHPPATVRRRPFWRLENILSSRFLLQ